MSSTSDLRAGFFSYIEMLASQDLKWRCSPAGQQAYKDAYEVLMLQDGLLHLKRTEIGILRRFLWMHQYQCCLLTGKRIKESAACLDHCHNTGRVRGVVHRSANGAEGGKLSGRNCGMPQQTLLQMAAHYRATKPGRNIIYPK